MDPTSGPRSHFETWRAPPFPAEARRPRRLPRASTQGTKHKVKHIHRNSRPSCTTPLATMYSPRSRENSRTSRATPRRLSPGGRARRPPGAAHRTAHPPPQQGFPAFTRSRKSPCDHKSTPHPCDMDHIARRRSSHPKTALLGDKYDFSPGCSAGVADMRKGRSRRVLSDEPPGRAPEASGQSRARPPTWTSARSSGGRPAGTAGLPATSRWAPGPSRRTAGRTRRRGRAPRRRSPRTCPPGRSRRPSPSGTGPGR